jgi:ribose transport system permease protein
LDLLVAVYLTAIVFAILYPVSFFSTGNLQAILNNLAVDGILAVGMMLLMISGVFDLSVGSMMSLAGVVTGWLLAKAGWSVGGAVAAGLGVAVLGGLANGLLVAKVRVNALIATLGTLGIFQGLAILIAGPSIANLPESFSRFGQTEVEVPVPYGPPLRAQLPVFGMLALAVVFHLLLTHSRFFRQYYYVGSNPKAARLSGINVERLQVLGFTLMGLIAGIAGLCFAARVGTSVSNAGVGAELRVITAVILGGASLTGGKGSIPGALIGVVFIALVNNVLIIARVSSYWQGIMVGVILVLAVALDSYRSRGRTT